MPHQHHQPNPPDQLPDEQQLQALLASLHAPDLREIAAGFLSDAITACQTGDLAELTESVNHWLAAAESMAATRQKLRPILAARKSKTDWRQHLSRQSEVCGGQLCARGTRILVTVILDNLAAGATDRQIIASYPSLKPIHINAALAYAAELESTATPELQPANAD